MGGYSKRIQKTRSENRIFLIVCDDKKTSPHYFEKFNHRYSRVKIETPDSGGLDPLNLVKHTKKLLNGKFSHLNLKAGDAAWCVFDRDEIPKDSLLEAHRLARQSKIQTCLSNPCFEVWYLLHYIHCNSCLVDCGSVISKLNTYIPKYRKNQYYFDELKPNMSDAIARAEKLLEQHEYNDSDLMSREGAPSTQAHVVVNQILDAIGQKK